MIAGIIVITDIYKPIQNIKKIQAFQKNGMGFSLLPFSSYKAALRY